MLFMTLGEPFFTLTHSSKDVYTLLHHVVLLPTPDGSNWISGSRVKARRHLEHLVGSITGQAMSPSWARHFRQIFSKHKELLDPLLADPFHRLLAHAATAVAFLTYSDTTPTTLSLSVLRLYAYSFLLVEGSRLTAEKEGFIGVRSKPQFNRVYHHALLMHHAEYLASEGNPPCFPLQFAQSVLVA